ncbi:MAG: sodium-dependent transporter [Thermogutta sp.]
MQDFQPRDTWTSRIGVILAVTGSAVGLGNFLRFPGLAAKYGGGAFMVAYLCAFLLLGLPIAFAEWSMGRYGGRHGFNSSPGIYRLVWKNRIAPYFGILAMIVPVCIYMYYVYIEAWCLAYAARYLFGAMDFGADPTGYERFFGHFVGIHAHGESLSTPSEGLLGSAVFFLILCFVLNFTLIYRGLSKGIEWFCRWAMPALIVCAFLVLIRVLTLGTPDAANPDQNILNGLGYMWNPVKPGTTFWEELANAEMWMAAAGQIFFSLSVGFGIIITYASYVKKDDDIALSCLTACAGNEFCEVALGGLITVPAAFVFLGPQVVQNPPGTFGLGFMALPHVFSQMPLGNLVGFLFFFLLFLAAVTSSLSMLQPAVAFLEEGLGLNRKASVAMLGFITAFGSTGVVFFSKDLIALDTLDFWIGTFSLYALAAFQTVLFGWVLGAKTGMDELRRGAEIHIPEVFRYIIQFVTPVYLFVVFGFWLRQNIFVATADGQPNRLEQLVTDPVVAAVMIFVAAVAVLFGLFIAQAVRNWRQAEIEEEEVAI